jgi:uncharacterized protein
MASVVRRYPFWTFVLLAYGWTWPLAALKEISLVFPLLGLFGPAVAAVVVCRATGDEAGVRSLFARFRIRRRDLPWLAVALLLPLALLVPTWLVAFWRSLGWPAPMAPITPLGLVLALLIVGEEIGWRGFALPHLLRRWPALAASVLLGLVWACWHLPNFLLPGYPHRGLPFPAFAIGAVAYSVLFTWIHGKTAGSLTAAVLLHAGINLFYLEGVDPALEYWLRAAVYGTAAAAVVALGGLRGLGSSRGGGAARGESPEARPLAPGASA